MYVYYNQFYHIVYSVFYVFCPILYNPLKNALPALTTVQHLSETLDSIYYIEKELLYIIYIFFWPYGVILLINLPYVILSSPPLKSPFYILHHTHFSQTDL